ncbi:MAG: hypothetical protein ACE367_09755 [Acidimicrobiales bacterium]
MKIKLNAQVLAPIATVGLGVAALAGGVLPGGTSSWPDPPLRPVLLAAAEPSDDTVLGRAVEPATPADGEQTTTSGSGDSSAPSPDGAAEAQLDPVGFTIAFPTPSDTRTDDGDDRSDAPPASTPAPAPAAGPATSPGDAPGADRPSRPSRPAGGGEDVRPAVPTARPTARPTPAASADETWGSGDVDTPVAPPAAAAPARPVPPAPAPAPIADDGDGWDDDRWEDDDDDDEDRWEDDDDDDEDRWEDEDDDDEDRWEDEDD